jgi:hypothetical protein
MNIDYEVVVHIERTASEKEKKWSDVFEMREMEELRAKGGGRVIRLDEMVI